MEPLGFTRLVVIGHGLIGGSIILAAGARLPQIDVLALDTGDPLDAAADADLIVLSTPVTAIVDLLAALRRVVGPATLITDTGSTKRTIVEAAAGLRFVGGHPVAGAEVSGRAAARPDLFVDRPWVFTPAPGHDPADVARLRGFAASLGARPCELDAAEHDRLFAFISHLPQLTASALMAVVGSAAGTDGLALAGTGLRDTTRLAGSPADIWRDTVRTNAADVRVALDALIDALTALRDDPDGVALTAVFQRAAHWRAQLR